MSSGRGSLPLAPSSRRHIWSPESEWQDPFHVCCPARRMPSATYSRRWLGLIRWWRRKIEGRKWWRVNDESFLWPPPANIVCNQKGWITGICVLNHQWCVLDAQGWTWSDIQLKLALSQNKPGAKCHHIRKVKERQTTWAIRNQFSYDPVVQSWHRVLQHFASRPLIHTDKWFWCQWRRVGGPFVCRRLQSEAHLSALLYFSCCYHYRQHTAPPCQALFLNKSDSGWEVELKEQSIIRVKLQFDCAQTEESETWGDSLQLLAHTEYMQISNSFSKKPSPYNYIYCQYCAVYGTMKPCGCV